MCDNNQILYSTFKNKYVTTTTYIAVLAKAIVWLQLNALQYILKNKFVTTTKYYTIN